MNYISLNSHNTQHFFIKSFGCQMNDYDSNRILSILLSLGYKQATSYHDASIIILNTCSVRQKAEDKVYCEIGRINIIKKNRPSLILAVGGCVAQHTGEDLIKRFPSINIVFGPHTLVRLPNMLERAFARETVIETDLKFKGDIYPPLQHFIKEKQVTAFVTIMQGCNNYCSYCIVPYVRGPEISRYPDKIIQEIRYLAHKGIKEVTLLGQNVNSYGINLKPNISFARLLYMIDSIENIERIRFTTSHPKDLSNELIYCIAELKKVCSHIHLPLQSGSNRILEMMNRSYTREQYLSEVEMLRTVIPNISITSDIIVGFPEETEKDFADTISIINEICFDDLFVFQYTDRPNTLASKLSGKIDHNIKIDRLMRLNDLQRSICYSNNKKIVGTTCEVLFDSFSKRDSGTLAGRTLSNKVVNCPASVSLIGKTLPVVIKKAHIHSLSGCLAV